MASEDEAAADGADETETGPPVPVVGIGASAGGLEAVGELLEALPDDTGMAYVYVQHIARDQESRLAEALARSTGMPVKQVDQDLQLEPDHVYVNSPAGALTVDGDTLHVEPRGEEDEVSHLIDRFLTSLAHERGSRAVGVVLSGTLSDGTRGLREIRGAGGFAIAQDPDTTSYRSMPRSAIQAGYVDMVLSPSAIADELTRLGRKALRSPGDPLGTGVPEPGEEKLQQLFDVVLDRSGVDFGQYKRSTLKRRLHRRMLANDTDRFEAYLDLLRDDPGEVEALHDEFLIQVTGFFRDDETFETLEKVAIPEILADREPDDPVRVWVPGCATGEEAYSIGIALVEAMDQEGQTYPVQIFGTDISESAIETARDARYDESIEVDMSEERVRRFFDRTNGRYEVAQRIRSMCVFAVQDVTTDPPFSDMDLISCRNLLIYMEPELQRRVASSIHYALTVDGILQVGESESLERFDEMFESIEETDTLWRKRDVSPPPIHDFPHRGPIPGGDPGAERAGRKRMTRDRLRHEGERKLLARYAPPSVIVTSDMEILEIQGEVGPYLGHTSGEPTFDLMEMAREGLLADLNKALQSARKSGDRAVREDVRVKQPNGSVLILDLEVEPVRDPGSDEPSFIVAFHEDGVAREPLGSTQPSQKRGPLSRLADRLRGGSVLADSPDEEIERLEEELEATRDYLESVIEDYEATTEELRSANEEALSANEELQSTNEELQTAKEELQSTNEELRTLNDELQERNREVEQVNDDLTNLLDSVQIPIVMLDRDLRIRRITPDAEDALNLIPGDVGRPLTEIRMPLNVGDLVDQVRDVVDSLETREIEIEGETGKPWRLRITPYRTSEDRIEGAVLVLLESGHD